MFEQFTDQARRVVVLAQTEARLLDHDYLGTEHLLLGLIREGDSDAAATLDRVGVTLEEVRAAVERVVGRGEQVSELGPTPFRSGAKTVLELAWRGAVHPGEPAPQERAGKVDRRLLPRLRRAPKSGDEIGPGHILLGVIGEGGVAVEVLDRLGVDLTEIRQDVTDAMRDARRTGEADDEP